MDFKGAFTLGTMAAPPRSPTGLLSLQYSLCAQARLWTYTTGETFTGFNGNQDKILPWLSYNSYFYTL